MDIAVILILTEVILREIASATLHLQTIIHCQSSNQDRLNSIRNGQGGFMRFFCKLNWREI